MSASKGSIIFKSSLVVVCVLVLWLVISTWNLRNLNPPCPALEVHSQNQSSSSSSSLLLHVPILPTVQTDNKMAATAITEVYNYANVHGGWVDINSLKYVDIQRLRDLGQTVMSRTVSCGKPKVFGQDVIASTSDLEYCFWKDDYVSDQSLDNFAFERHLVEWVFREFRDLDKTLQKLYPLTANNNTTWTCPLGFLDVGVNVGDWASQLVAALPATPFYGIEGTPSTSAIAMANMRTSIEHRLHSSSSNVSATTLLLPFSLIPLNMVDTVRGKGGLCYGADPGNVGGQGVVVQSDTAAVVETCQPNLIAGGTLLSHALQSIATIQPSCPGKQDWPRIYVAKFDIQRFEFKVMTEAMHWFSARPPCYIMIEVMNEPQTHGIIELLLDIGYDSVWRTHNTYPKDEAHEHEEFPPDPPFWSRSRNTSMTLHEAADIDLATISVYWGNKDYIFGFEDKEKCIRRLLG